MGVHIYETWFKTRWGSISFFGISHFIKLINSEEATKFCEIFTLLLSYVVPVKSKVKISHNFMAFSEYMIFNYDTIFIESPSYSPCLNFPPIFSEIQKWSYILSPFLGNMNFYYSFSEFVYPLMYLTSSKDINSVASNQDVFLINKSRF